MFAIRECLAPGAIDAAGRFERAPPKAAPNYAIEVVECCLASLIRCQASDLHLQPRREHWDVACRVDGVMQPMGQIPKSASSDPTARLMALANLPSYHAGTPQEGPLAWTDSREQTHEIRLGIFPTVHASEYAWLPAGCCSATLASAARRSGGFGRPA